MDIAWAPDGTLLIADAGTNQVRTWSPTAGLGTLRTQSELHTPHGVAAGPDGTVYVADMDTRQVVAIDAEGEVTRVAGTGEQGDGPLQLSRPAALLVLRGTEGGPSHQAGAIRGPGGRHPTGLRSAQPSASQHRAVHPRPGRSDPSRTAARRPCSSREDTQTGGRPGRTAARG